MLAMRFPGILSPLTNKQALETAAIASISNRGFAPENWKIPPFMAPHHSACPVPADRCHEPLPVRLPRRFQRPMSLHIGAGPAVPEPSVRPAT
ncbi:MAG: hypothetical protein DSY87_08730 [Methylococcus sp.]|nr:MAG: hypothetical protein DSY87_08730 [Methylococcus sp.]